MTTEWMHDTEPAIGSEIAALRDLTADVAGDLDASERLVAVSWGRTSRKVLTVYPWAAAGLVAVAAGLVVIDQRWSLWAAMAVVAVAGVAMAVGWPAVMSRIPGYGVLLTDQRLIVVRTRGSNPPRPKQEPASIPRGDVSVVSGHGFFGTTVLLTLTTPVTAAPLRLTFDSQYVPAATAVYLSLTSAGAITSLRLPPPQGPALADSRTRAVLRRYRYGTWLLILIGIACFAVPALFFNSPEITYPDWLMTVILACSIGFTAVGVFYRVRAARWHRVLSRCPWQEISYRYSERVEWTYAGENSSKNWLPSLAAEPLTEPGKHMVLSISAAGTRLGWWRLRVWRQAPTGVAWLAGDPSHRVIVAPPGPGRLFSASYSSGTPDGAEIPHDDTGAA